VSGPTLADLLAALANSKAEIDTVFMALEAVSPDALKGTEEEVRAAVQAALAGLDLPGATAAAEAVLKVLRAGGGPVGGGFDATLA